MKKRILAILFALVLVVGFVAACGGDDDAREPGGLMRGIFITQDLSNASQAFSANEFQRLMGDYNAEVIIAGGDVADNIANIERAIADGLDFIFINPNDIMAVIPGLTAAREAGIIVGLFSSQPPEDVADYPYDFFAGSDDILGGEQAGKFVSEQFPDGANFVEIGGQAGHIAATSRADGFRRGIAANIIELDSQFVPGPWVADEARGIMEDFLIMYGDDIDIVWCHWDHGAAGVIEAVVASGRDASDIFIIGVDGNSTGYQQVVDGLQALSVGQSFTNMAAKSLELARIMFDGGTVAEKLNWIPLDMVTIDTYQTFPWPDW